MREVVSRSCFHVLLFEALNGGFRDTEGFQNMCNLFTTKKCSHDLVFLGDESWDHGVLQAIKIKINLIGNYSRNAKYFGWYNKAGVT